MALRIHGRPSHPHKAKTGRNRRTTSRETSKAGPPYPRHPRETRSLPQTREMFFRTGGDQLPRSHSREGQIRNGPAKAEWRRRLASTQKPHRCLFLPRVHRLLPLLRPELFKSRPTPPRPNKEKPRVALGRGPVQGLRNAQNPHVPKAGPHPTRLRSTFLPTDRRLRLRNRSSTLPRARRKRYPFRQKGKTETSPHRILFRHIHPHRAELRHL